MEEKTYVVTLFGHRDLCEHDRVEKLLYDILHKLIENKQFVEVYIGRNGEFDVFAASVVKRVKKAFGSEKCSLTLVLPYTVRDIEFYEKYYDDIIIPDIVNVYPKAAISKRNRFMVEQCDLLICYVEHDKGGAYTALKYANKLSKKVINLAKDIEIY